MIFASMLRVVLGALLLVAPFAFAFGLPWVKIGIWHETETVTVALHFVSGLLAVAIAALALAGDRRAAAALRHPVTLCFAAISGLTVLQAMLSPIAGFDAPRTLHGLIGYGIGGLWFLDCAVLFAGYLAIGSDAWRNAHAAAGGAAACLASLLTLAWPPHTASGWLGPLAILAATPLFAARPRAMPFLGGAALAVGAAVSESATTWVAIIVATFAVSVIAKGRFALEKDRFRAAAMISSTAFLLGIPAGLALLPEPLELVSTSQITPAIMSIDGIPSVDPRDHVSIDAKPYGSLWATARKTRAVVDSLFQNPLYLAIGRGWGAYPDIIAEQLRTIPGRAFASGSETSSRTLWQKTPTDELYSGNLLLESLASLGVAGALLVGLLLVSPLVWAGPRTVLPAAFLVIGFAIAVVTGPLRNAAAPFLALAFASVSHIDRRRCCTISRRTVAGLASPLAAAGAGISLVYFASIMLGVANLEYKTRQAQPLQVPNPELCRPVAGHLIPARDINAALFRRFVDQGETEPAPFAWFTRRILATVNYSCIMRDLAEHGAGAAFLVSFLELRHRLLLSSGNFPPIVTALDPEVKHWGDDIAHLLAVAPDRTDLIIPYVSWIVAGGDKDASLAAISAMIALATDPADPVAAWLKSKRAELMGNEAEYRAQMTVALRAGLANLIPMRRSETDGFVRRGIAGR
ncbi:hypothetical protein ACVIGB_000107 [Bradyrhizobium sp. USDA 4341]